MVVAKVDVKVRPKVVNYSQEQMMSGAAFNFAGFTRSTLMRTRN